MNLYFQVLRKHPVFAGRTAAVLSSFITTCKRLGIDPFAYLRDIFERISTLPENQIAELLPDKWMLTRRFAPVGNISAKATHMAETWRPQ
jgi:hypothetical protein